MVPVRDDYDIAIAYRVLERIYCSDVVSHAVVLFTGLFRVACRNGFTAITAGEIDVLAPAQTDIGFFDAVFVGFVLPF